MEQPKKTHRLSTVDKATSLLALFLKYDHFGLVEIENELSISKTAAFRLASTLTDRGFLIKNNETKTYQPGPVLFQIVHKYESNDLPSIVQPFVEQLAHQTSESVYLAIRTGKTFTFLSGIESTHPLKVTNPLGIEDELYCSSSGKLYLAFMPEKDRNQYLKHVKFTPFTPTTITNKNALLLEIEKIRKNGYSLSNAERVVDCIGIAAPIFGFAQEPIACISLLLPISRYNPTESDELIQQVCEAAKQASEAVQQFKKS